VANVFFVMFMVFYTGLIGVGIMLIWRVYKNGGAKMTSSYMSVFGSVGANLASMLMSVQYFIVRANWDKNWGFIDATYYIPSAFIGMFAYWYRLEIICTWCDIFQKSVNLSKRSSVAITVLRYFCKFAALFTLSIGLMSTFRLGAYEDMVKIQSTVMPAITTSACLVVAPLLIRVLCEDMRNVNHPNWKSAAAIRRAAFNEPFCQLAYFLMIVGYQKTSLSAYQAGIISNAILVIFFFYQCISQGEWFGYQLFAQRRYLKGDDAVRMSQYYGFTTLGPFSMSKMLRR